MSRCQVSGSGLQAAGQEADSWTTAAWQPAAPWRLIGSHPLDDQDIYPAIGEAGFTRLIAAFYQQVPGRRHSRAMYPPRDLAGAEQRLRDFLIGRFGGPQRYIEQRGHPPAADACTCRSRSTPPLARAGCSLMMERARRGAAARGC